jgi:hypothetical protein
MPGVSSTQPLEIRTLGRYTARVTEKLASTREIQRLPKAAAMGPSLEQLVAAQNRVEQVWRDRSFVHPFTDEQLLTIAYALGVLSTERLAVGERLRAKSRVTWDRCSGETRGDR